MAKPEDPLNVVSEQADDEALWQVYPPGGEPVVEAMLKEALRRLHAALEQEPFKGFKGRYQE